MPASGIGEFIGDLVLRPVLRLLIEGVCHGTGRVLLRCIGVDPSRLATSKRREPKRPLTNRQRAIRRRRQPGPTTEESAAAAEDRRFDRITLIGLLFWLIVAAVIVVIVLLRPSNGSTAP